MQDANLEYFKTLLQVMKKLRGPEGCPWDREQTRDTLKWYLVEECYEALDAIEKGLDEKIKEELGDILFQIIFLAEISEEDGMFNIFDVINSAREKMVRRHPHVFQNENAKDSEEVKKIWQKIKKEEKKDEEGSILDSIPKNLPSLLRAFRITKGAAQIGFDWNNVEGVFNKIKEEIEEFRETLKEKDKEGMENELGDILFSLVNLGRFLEINPEDALRKTINKFIMRFKNIEISSKKKDKEIYDLTMKEMDKLWDEAKKNG
ncbi:MAG: nucleoside triphosphate pyrophosphohydrolase [Pseudomonadota bacterium]